LATQDHPTEDAPTADSQDSAQAEARREFLMKCGKLAVITPPAVTLLLTAASRQAAASGFGDPGKHKFKDRHKHHHRHHDSDGDRDR